MLSSNNTQQSLPDLAGKARAQRRPRRPNLTVEKAVGLRFGKLIIIGLGCKKQNTCSLRWVRTFVCRCDCGRELEAELGHIRSGTRRCVWCSKKVRKATYVPKNKTHGQAHTKAYHSWRTMFHRCKTNERYILKGIVVCARWLVWDNFISDMGQPPKGRLVSIGRINNDGNYEPGNCRWETPSQQQNNTCLNRPLTYGGITMNATQWARAAGISKHTFFSRLDRGWPVEKAIKKPVEYKYGKRTPPRIG